MGYTPSISFSGVKIPSYGLIYADEESDTLPDADGDGYADDNDICPNDKDNDCSAAIACQKLKDGYDNASGGSNWFAWISGIFTVLTGLAALLFPGVGLAAYFSIHAAVNAIVSLGIGVSASDWKKQYKASGCEDLLGWK